MIQDPRVVLVQPADPSRQPRQCCVARVDGDPRTSEGVVQVAQELGNDQQLLSGHTVASLRLALTLAKRSPTLGVPR